MPRLVASGLVLLTVLAGTSTVRAAPIIVATAGASNDGAPGFGAPEEGEVALRGPLVQQVVDVPEPSSLLLFGTALLIVAAFAKRRSRKAK